CPAGDVAPALDGRDRHCARSRSSPPPASPPAEIDAKGGPYFHQPVHESGRGDMQARGKYQALIDAAKGEPRQVLAATGHILLEQTFDPVPLEPLGVERSEYEARCSDSCSACGRIWLGTKAGEVIELELGTDRSCHWKHSLTRSVRALIH